MFVLSIFFFEKAEGIEKLQEVVSLANLHIKQSFIRIKSCIHNCKCIHPYNLKIQSYFYCVSGLALF